MDRKTGVVCYYRNPPCVSHPEIREKELRQHLSFIKSVRSMNSYQRDHSHVSSPVMNKVMLCLSKFFNFDQGACCILSPLVMLRA